MTYIFMRSQLELTHTSHVYACFIFIIFYLCSIMFYQTRYTSHVHTTRDGWAYVCTCIYTTYTMHIYRHACIMYNCKTYNICTYIHVYIYIQMRRCDIHIHLSTLLPRCIYAIYISATRRTDNVIHVQLYTYIYSIACMQHHHIIIARYVLRTYIHQLRYMCLLCNNTRIPTYPSVPPTFVIIICVAQKYI